MHVESVSPRAYCLKTSVFSWFCICHLFLLPTLLSLNGASDHHPPPPKKKKQKHVAGQQGPWQCKTLRRSSHSSTTRLSPHCSPCQDLCHHSPGSPPSWRRRIALLNPNHEPKPHHSMVDQSMPTSRPVKPGVRALEGSEELNQESIHRIDVN